MHDVFNFTQLKPFTAKRSPLDDIDHHADAVNPADDSEVLEDLWNEELDKAFNPPIQAREFAAIFRTHFSEKCELREKVQLLTQDMDARPGANVHLDTSDDVMLAPFIFWRACKQLLFSPSVDLFATAAHKQVVRYYSPFPDPHSAGLDAFGVNWQLERRPYANPP